MALKWLLTTLYAILAATGAVFAQPVQPSVVLDVEAVISLLKPVREKQVPWQDEQGMARWLSRYGAIEADKGNPCSVQLNLFSPAGLAGLEGLSATIELCGKVPSRLLLMGGELATGDEERLRNRLSADLGAPQVCGDGVRTLWPVAADALLVLMSPFGSSFALMVIDHPQEAQKCN